MRRWMTGALVGLVACGAPAGDAPDSEPDVAPADSVMEAEAQPLASSFGVQVNDSVRFRLDVTNTTAEPLVLEFSTAQRYDFAVERGGVEVWRWSSDMGFAQMLGSDTLAAGETRSYGAAWAPGDSVGEYEAVAQLTSLSHPVELRTPFELTRE